MNDNKPRMPEVCVVYIQRVSPTGVREVLLGRKKVGLGVGHFVAPGGKLEPGESPSHAAVREVAEEVGLVIDPTQLTLIGELTYPFPHREEFSQKSWAFAIEYGGGAVAESVELDPVWVAIDRLPLDQMWDDAKYWLPDALAGEFARATFSFGPDGRTVETSDHPRFPAN